MRTHELKTWPAPWQAVRDGIKTFESRVDDRGFAVGDMLVLREWDPRRECFTGRVQSARVTYIMRDENGWTKPGWVVMSIEHPLAAAESGGAK